MSFHDDEDKDMNFNEASFLEDDALGDSLDDPYADEDAGGSTLADEEEEENTEY